MNDKLVYQPEDVNTVPYNVFYSIDSLEDNVDKNEALEKLAFLLIPDLPPQESSANARFYNDEGRKILTAALIAFYYKGLDFIEICEKIMGSSYQQLFREIDDTENELAIRYINAFAGTSEQNIAGCMQNASEAIRLFATNHYVANSIRRPEYGEECFTPAMIETHNVFFVIDDTRLDVYAPLVHLVVAQVLDFFAKRSNAASHNILLCLDELASFGKLELIGALRKLRKKKVRIFCLTQSLADLQMIYGHDETKAMLTNFAFKVILGAADTETQEYFSKLIGHKKRNAFNIIKQMRLADFHIYENVKQEYSVRPEDLALLGDKLILLYPGGHVSLRKNYYFK
ncbi:MAG: type IV secretory system conjugative DNA transfer family protein [Clostridiales bacterium]|nr:type IV secretory system conjugative DNA transfer family protein [Clostridiales bacterium]